MPLFFNHCIVACHCESHLLQCPGLGQQFLKLSRVLHLDQAAKRSTVVATADVLSLQPNGWHRRATNQINHLGSNGLAVVVLIEFDDGELSTKVGQEFLGLDAKGSRRKGQHQDGLILNQAIQARPYGLFVVIAGQGSDQGEFALLKRIGKHLQGRVAAAGAAAAGVGGFCRCIVAGKRGKGAGGRGPQPNQPK
eukprot:CAMPEP_0168741308 /NCGR_PEP_ID=MMETSP0724-20121128/12440_1 /TAXON_ID=265536 /ORGANISM="Amphiprora sp., Strain CCMP467" /LENGTH=193 /DNA_ID=CAMNT_0008788795 /DNA_START=255 /DNA_END=836 /DNA_ORIENTATION=-